MFQKLLANKHLRLRDLLLSLIRPSEVTAKSMLEKQAFPKSSPQHLPSRFCLQPLSLVYSLILTIDTKSPNQSVAQLTATTTHELLTLFRLCMGMNERAM